MFEPAMELLRRLIGTLVAIIDIAYALIYCTFASIIYGIGAIILFLSWCAFCVLLQSVAEYVPIKRYIDRRLQDEFLRNFKDMSRKELTMRARLINVGEDIKMRNETNNVLLQEICSAERYTAPSAFAVIRWLWSQDYETHRLECSIAGFAAQLEQNKQLLRSLDREHDSLESQLSQVLTKKREVRHKSDLPNYEQMYRNFDAALESMRTLRHHSPLHQSIYTCTIRQDMASSYPEWLVPPKRLHWWEWGLLVPGQAPPQITSLPDVGNWSAPLSASAPAPNQALAAVSAAPVSMPFPPLKPLFGPAPPAAAAAAAAAPEPLPTPGNTSVAPMEHTTPPPAPAKTLSLAERLRDPAGLRARPPTPPPPSSPRSYRSRF
ncbi:hypothetical protein J7T55_005450 [Diaporthe amygdali]|uniref:uncharacterized protein n=1 Tax=Phomopsis amygdali TaxID=1214568 RepID=UPI0022FE6215|nr:uncharacterized protein J7T55_005450 [Diaporthe amygdali]KAJ0108907.1 hypothetical protein J7T55_005450 [Diaporthe amygdali]